MQRTLIPLAVVAVLVCTVYTRAAELRLKPQCQISGAVVTLGDVADILVADQEKADALAGIELFPTPAPSQQRFVRLREIQDLLFSRGVNLTEHRFSGSSQVNITGASGRAHKKSEQSLSSTASRRADRQVCRAVVQYLQQRTSVGSNWTAEVNLTPDQARILSNPSAKISLCGGRPPWTGKQRFEATVHTADGPARFQIDAEVSTPPEFVVAVHSLSRGVMIRETDVELRSVVSEEASSDAFRTLDEVIGTETTQAVPNGKVLRSEMVRSPLMVRRGEMVTVIARRAGIRIRTTARARNDGSRGETVAVESLLDRTRYFTRVVAVREVEVCSTGLAAVALNKRTR